MNQCGCSANGMAYICPAGWNLPAGPFLLRVLRCCQNILVIGGSGSGKTRFFVKPNLMQLHSSYVVTDPKGTLLVECGKMLEKNGYAIKSLNTINFRKSMHYNPFAYIHSEKDILKLVTTLIANTKGEGKGGDDFWVSATRSQAVKSLRTSNGFPLFGELVV